MQKIILFTVLIIFVFLTSGCHKKTGMFRDENNRRLKYSEQSLNTPVSDEINNIEKMERCRRELDALKKVDVNFYNKRKSEFDKLMSDAVIYNGVRVDVKEYTQGTVDALYRFRVNKLCADISSDILNKLTE